MKNVLQTLLTLAVITLFLASCKKDDDTNQTLSKAWKVNSQSYSQLTAIGANMGPVYALMAVEEMPGGSNPINSFTVYFKTRPTADGTYKVTYHANLADLLPDEAMINAKEKSGNTEAVATDANTGKVVTVKIEGGKLNITVPQVAGLRGPLTGSKNEAVTLEGNITE
ncbi:MAG: hypothetical protein U0T75_00350 [Chitinophagales bacterium]